MVFYAYAKNSNDDWSWRYVMITPDRQTMDGWYDTVRSKVGDSNIRRVSADFYVFDRNKFHLGINTREHGEAPEYLNKMIFQLLSDNEGRNITSFINH